MLVSTFCHSSPHTPQSHGNIERQNQIYNDIVKVLNFDQFQQMAARWDEHVKMIQFFLNYSLVGHHGMLQLFFFFGCHPHIPATIMLPDEAIDACSLEFVQSFQTSVQEAVDVAQCRLI